MGGMSALSLLSRHPDLARNHINISGAVHSLPFSIAIRSLQREAIRFDPNWNRGHYSNESYPKCGVVTARKLGVITYRSAMEWNCRFGRTSLKNTDRHMNESPFSPEFEVEGYLDCHAHRFLFHFDPNCYLYLSRSIDWFDLGESGNSTADQVLSQLRLEKALIIGVPNDILFPVHQQKQIADGLTGSRTETQFLPLDSLEGHDAFLVDLKRFGPPISTFLKTL
jgi:homoserine O-acetyltransferase